ncbi:MAG: methyltransferase domain-containing protein [Deltaproteobacteria bacterium]|nr:methyltransferase domain-containing protein [Deltaproteobacteria bacterium]
MTEKKIEQLLRRGMQAVGQVVEKAIGKAAAAKQTVVSNTVGAGMPLTIESQLPVPKVREVLRLAAERVVHSIIPALSERRVLELADGVGQHAGTLRDHGARLVVATEIGAANSVVTTDAVSRQYLVRAWVHRLPFRDGAFDFAIANLLTPYQGDFLRALKEIGRVVTAGGTVVLADFHPFGAFARRGAARVRPSESTFRGVADYYKAARLAGVRVTDVREAFLDEGLRSAFVTVEEKQAYRALRDMPLVLCLVAKKGGSGEVAV